MIPHHVSKPISSLLDAWTYALPASIITTSLWTVAERVFDVYGQLLTMDAELVGMALLAVVLDTATGMAAVVREGSVSDLSSKRFRAFAWKVIEFGSIVVMCNGLANASMGTFLEPVFGHFGIGSLFYVMAVEGWSLAENWNRLGAVAAISALVRGKGLSGLKEHLDETSDTPSDTA